MAQEPRETPGDPKLREKGTGALEWRRGHRWVRVSLPDSTRPRYRLCKDVCECKTMSDARAEDMAKAISTRERARVQAELDAQEKARTEKRLTVKQFGELWTSDKLFELHGEVRGLKVKKTAKIDGYRLKAYVYDEIGDRPLADITEQDIERVMMLAARKAREKLGRPWRQSAKFQLYQVLRRLFDLAIRPGRLRTDNPVSKDFRPSRDKPKLFGYLYPSEVVALLAAKEVPIGRRVLYALAVYTGLRKGSLFALRWGGVDFVNRTLTSLESKTGLPQMFELDAGLAALLQSWKERCGNPGKDALVIRDLELRREREASVLRTDLQAAGVMRDSLIGSEGNVEKLRFHDLRATFVTWAMRQGRGDGWISDRTGHLTPEMRARYARAARTLADLNYEPFPDVSNAIPEFTEEQGNVRRVDFGGPRGGA